MRHILLLVVIVLAVTACTKQNGTEGNGKTLLRINNKSALFYDSVIVNSPGGKQVYYNVAANSYSGYKPFNFLYHYAYIEVHFNNQLTKLQPIDYVGEEKLNPGKYSYELMVLLSSQPSVSLVSRKD
nr:hypothetical protein [uncultured Lacibacter sp.]